MELKHLFFLLFYAGMMIFLTSCGSNGAPIPVAEVTTQTFEEEKIAVNQEIVRREHADIALVAKRYHWNLTQTSTGLFYEILNKKKGIYPQTKDRVQIKGKIYLQDGTEIYNDQADGIKELIINRSDDVVGLHELLKLMCEGEKSRAIIPSYLAFGISGDGEQIPALAFLICEIELIKINKNK